VAADRAELYRQLHRLAAPVAGTRKTHGKPSNPTTEGLPSDHLEVPVAKGFVFFASIVLLIGRVHVQ
jgi:hypothetical protein